MNNIRFSDLNNNELLVTARYAFVRASKHFAQYVVVDEDGNIIAPAFNPAEYLVDCLGFKNAVEEVQSDWYVRTKNEIKNRNAKTIREEHYCSVVGMCNAIREYARWHRRLPQLGKDDDLLETFKNTLVDRSPSVDEEAIGDEVFEKILDAFIETDTGNGYSTVVGLLAVTNNGSLSHTEIAKRIGISRRMVDLIFADAKEYYYSHN